MAHLALVRSSEFPVIDDLTKIRIMADYSDAYAWDQNGVCIALAPNFPDQREVAAIERELDAWAGDFAISEDNDPNFPWEEFHARGLALATRLHNAVPEAIGIEICYQGPYEDPKGKMRDEPIILRHRKKT